jgi:uncharacterized membrane protein
MIPFLVLAVVTALTRILSTDWIFCLRCGLAAMFLLTASAHWGKRRADLIRMVPPAFPRPDLIVTVTGIFELLGVIGLLLPSTARLAAVCLAVLLLAMFPANVYAARRALTIGGRPATPLLLRTILQLAFLAALLLVAM